MKKQVNRDLLVDLARLARRYPTQDWDSLLEWLQNDTRRAKLVDLIRGLSDVSRQTTSRSKHKRNVPTITRLLEDIRAENLAKAEVLEEFWRKLRSRELLPTSSSLRMFSETSGLKSDRTSKREQAINDLIRGLSKLPLADIQKALEKNSMTPHGLGDEYERWVALILGRRTSDSDS